MIEIAAGASVMVNVVCGIYVIGGALAGIDAVSALGAGVGEVSIIVNIAVENLVPIGPNGDTALGAVPDFKAVDDVVTAIDINPDVTIGDVLPIEYCAPADLRAQGDRTGSCAAAAQVKPPTARIIRIDSGHHQNAITGFG